MKQEFNDIDGKLNNENELLVKVLNMKTNQEKKWVSLTKCLRESRCLLHKPDVLNSIPRIDVKVEK